MDNLYRNAIKSITYSSTKFPIVALIGARQVGKTTLLKHFAKNNRVYDLERESDFQLIDSDPEFFLNSITRPIFIDEAQFSPRLFKALRVFVDQKRDEPFQVMISGSSSSQLLSSISESLAGRVAIIEMGTLSINETQSETESSVYNLIKEAQFDLLNSVNIKERSWTDLLWYGGFPEPVIKKDPDYKIIWSENYIKTYIDRDIRRLFPDLNVQAYMTFLKLLANTSGDIINYSLWSSALGVSEPTVKKYLQIAEGTFLFRILPAFTFHSQGRLIKSPKGYLRDSGLLSSLLRIQKAEDLVGHPRAGAIFETFCTEQIIKSLKEKNTYCEFSYFRNKEKVEIDLILEFPKHKIPIEIKLGREVRNESLKGLDFFIKKYNSPFGILLNNSQEIREIKPKIIQLPFGAL